MPVTSTPVSVSSPTFVSVTVTVTELPCRTFVRSTGLLLFKTSIVAGLMTSTSPERTSSVSGAAAPRLSVESAVALQLKSSDGALKVHEKSTEALGAREATFAGDQLAHEPVPVTWTLANVSSPVFVSVTTIVIDWPA